MKSGFSRIAGIVGVVLAIIVVLWGVFIAGRYAPGLFANIGRMASAPFSAKFDRAQTAALGEAAPPAQSAEPATTTAGTATPLRVESSALTTTSGNAGASPAPTPVKTETPPPSKPVSNPNGFVDLSVRILSTAQGSAQFEIKNNGTKVAPAGWTFSASLPLPAAYMYASPPQQALPPQGYIINNLGWAPPASNCSQFQTTPGYQPYPNVSSTQNCAASSYGTGGTFTVSVDQQNVTGDSNSANNTASAVISN